MLAGFDTWARYQDLKNLRTGPVAGNHVVWAARLCALAKLEEALSYSGVRAVEQAACPDATACAGAVTDARAINCTVSSVFTRHRAVSRTATVHLTFGVGIAEEVTVRRGGITLELAVAPAL